MPRSTTKSAKADTTVTKRAARATKPAARRARATHKAPAGAAVTHDAIALRAYEIHLSAAGGDPVDHWLRAERELTAA
jgi:hypothetical protein